MGAAVGLSAVRRRSLGCVRSAHVKAERAARPTVACASNRSSRIASAAVISTVAGPVFTSAPNSETAILATRPPRQERRTAMAEPTAVSMRLLTVVTASAEPGGMPRAIRMAESDGERAQPRHDPGQSEAREDHRLPALRGALLGGVAPLHGVVEAA